MRLGAQIGNYVLERELAKGGFGVVFVARHVHMGQRVAVKFLHRQWSEDHDQVQRFFNDARAATLADDPGIVKVIDSGFLDGSAFLIMEFLAGEPLARRLERGPMSSLLAVTLVRQMARALSKVHAVGIIHRDLKPDNIILVADPEVPGGERVKLLDFGIAKLADAAKSNKTATRAVFGTPAYMSPEQCRSSANVDPRSDIYSLGCILFEMVCGKPPFEGETGDLIGKHQYVAPPRPSSMNARIASGVEGIILATLAKDPAARPQSMRELVRELDGLIRQMTPSLDVTQNEKVLLEPEPKSPPPVVIATVTESPPRKRRREAAPAVDMPKPVTTLGHATGEQVIPSRRSPRSKILLVLGGLAVATASAGIFLVSKETSHSNPDAGSASSASTAGGAGAPRRDGADVQATAATPSDSSKAQAALPPRSTRPDVETPLSQARKAIAKEQWDSAVRAANLALKADPENAEARRMHDQAGSELGNEAVFNRYTHARDAGRIADAVKFYRELPDSSVYLAKASGDLARMHDGFLRDSDAQARTFLQKKQCDKITALAKTAGDVFPDAREAVEKVGAECGTGAEGSATPPELTKPGPAAVPPASPSSAREPASKPSAVDRDEMLRDAKAAYQNGKWDETQQKAKEILKTRPGDQEALLLIGMATCKQGDRVRAVQIRDQLNGVRRDALISICKQNGVHIEEQRCDEVACLVTPDLPCCPKGRSAAEAPAPAVGSSLPDKLDQDDIRQGLGAVTSKVMACNDQFHIPGSFKVHVTANPEGDVTDAKADPPIGGSAAGPCVERALRDAKFRKTKSSLTFGFPFTFH